MDFKYESQWGGWCINGDIGSSRVGLWKFIRRGWEEFSRFTRFEVSDGSKINFCHDMWCGEQPLKEVFSELFSIACSRDPSMADHLPFLNGSPQWLIL